MGNRRWTFACALALVAATGGRGARAEEPVGPRDLARAGHEKKLAGLTLMIGGGALVATGIGLTIAGFASDDPTRCHANGGFYYYAYRTDAYVVHDNNGDCWNQSLVLAGGTTWLLGAASLGIGIPVYLIGARQLRDAARWRQWLVTRPPQPSYVPAPPPSVPPSAPPSAPPPTPAP